MNKLKQNIVHFKNVNFSYKKNSSYKNLNNISFEILHGEFIVVIGHNGSGKSTLLKLIAGLLGEFEGEVKILDSFFKEKNHRDLLDKIGIIFQNPESQFIKETVDQELAFGLENKMSSNLEMRDQIIDIAKKLKLESILFSNLVELTAAEKQKIAIASTLILKPELILFDEPTSLLDFSSKQEVINMIDEISGFKTIIEITHNMERILKSDKVLVMKKGKIVFFDKPQKLIELFDVEELEDSKSFELPFNYKLSLKLFNNNIIKNKIISEEELIKTICQLKI